MFETVFNVLLGCAHRRTTFPITPSRKSGRLPLSGAARRGTYVVCLDCGKEFGYDWAEMRIGDPVAAPFSPRAATPADARLATRS